MIFLIPSITLLAALWVYFDSQKHGFSFGRGLLWSILVFFFLILFLPLYLVIRKRSRFQQSREPGPPVRHTCLYCRQSYEGEPQVCPHCGQDLSRS